MTEIHSVTIQIARPMGNDPGTIEQSHYRIDKNVVILCHRDGSPIRAARRPSAR
jgi:hypothetical protein